MGIREEFEKLEDVKQGLRHCHYNGSTNDYHADVAHEETHEWHTQFVNGAWYAFQEQQKKIDAIKSKLSDIYDASDEDETVAHLLDEIQELLK
ncbi:MAG: hypothetical protein RSE38_00785 [Acinetobacter sp.]